MKDGRRACETDARRPTPSGCIETDKGKGSAEAAYALTRRHEYAAEHAAPIASTYIDHSR
jgi:hypothetical protein